MKKLLFFILLLAFILRITGINYGLPMFFVGDEVSITAGALKMLELKTLVPAAHPEAFRILYYPPLLSYISLLAIVPVLVAKLVVGHLSITALKNQVTADPAAIWLATRALTSLMGLFTVYITYRITRKLFSIRAAVISAFFTATSFLAVSLSHFARHWTGAVLFCYLAIYFCFTVYFEPKKRNYLLAGLFCGLAFGASYIAGISVLVLLLVHFFSSQDWKEKLFHFDFLQGLGLGVVVVAIFTALNFPEFHRIVFGEDAGAAGGSKSLIGLAAALVENTRSFFLHEPVLLMAAVSGLIVLYFHSRKLFAIFLTFPLIYWVILYFFFHFEPRYNSLLVPLFAILSGLAFDRLFGYTKRFRPLYPLAIVVIIFPVSTALYYDALLLKPDTRLSARVWIELQIRENSKIALYTNSLELFPSRESAKNLISLYPAAVRTKDRVLAEWGGGDYPKPAFEVVNYHLFPADNLPANAIKLKDAGFEYLVLEYFNDSDVPKIFMNQAVNAQLIKSFSSQPERNFLGDPNGNIYDPIWKIFQVKNLGPHVQIYKL